MAVAIASAVALAAGVALTAQELADLSLQRGLHDQPHTQPGDRLQHLAEVLLGGEQLVDLDADTLDSRYSRATGVDLLSASCQLCWEPTPVLLFHRYLDATEGHA